MTFLEGSLLVLLTMANIGSWIAANDAVRVSETTNDVLERLVRALSPDQNKESK